MADSRSRACLQRAQHSRSFCTLLVSPSLYLLPPRSQARRPFACRLLRLLSFEAPGDAAATTAQKLYIAFYFALDEAPDAAADFAMAFHIPVSSGG